MSDETTTTETPQAADKYVKLADPGEGNELTVKLRFLDYPGVLVFRHWIGEGPTKRPFNCPGGKNGCPACKERTIAKVAGGEYKDIHRMDARHVVNVLELSKEDPKLKVFSYGPAIAKRLDSTIARGEKYADPTGYDITVMKRKTGPAVFDVEYDVFYESHRELSGTEKALASQKHDLKLEATPANTGDIIAAMKGVKTGPQLATPDQRKKVDQVLKQQGLSFLDVRITNPDNLTKEQADTILKDLG